MRSFLFALALVLTSAAFSKPKVVATTTDIGAIVHAVAGDDIDLEVIARGTQDPHFIETKPSYMVKLSRADLVVANGLALESGWLPALIRGARNPKLSSPSGLLELGSKIKPLEIPHGQISRAMGDVHPEGNPHFTLDPLRVAEAAPFVAERLGELAPAQKAKFSERADAFAKDLTKRVEDWQRRASKLSQKK